MDQFKNPLQTDDSLIVNNTETPSETDCFAETIKLCLDNISYY